MQAATANAPKFGGGSSSFGGGSPLPSLLSPPHPTSTAASTSLSTKDSQIAEKNRLRFASKPNHATLAPQTAPPPPPTAADYDSDTSFDGDLKNAKSLTGLCQRMCPEEVSFARQTYCMVQR